jgi:hypothetical protein
MAISLQDLVEQAPKLQSRGLITTAALLDLSAQGFHLALVLLDLGQGLVKLGLALAFVAALPPQSQQVTLIQRTPHQGEFPALATQFDAVVVGLGRVLPHHLKFDPTHGSRFIGTHQLVIGGAHHLGLPALEHAVQTGRGRHVLAIAHLLDRPLHPQGFDGLAQVTSQGLKSPFDRPRVGVIGWGGFGHTEQEGSQKTGAQCPARRAEMHSPIHPLFPG